MAEDTIYKDPPSDFDPKTAAFIDTNQAGVAHPSKGGPVYIATDGTVGCITVVARNPTTGAVGLAHIMAGQNAEDIRSIYAPMVDQLRSDPSHPIEIRMFGGLHPNGEPYLYLQKFNAEVQTQIGAIPNSQVLSADIGDKPHPIGVVVNTHTGELIRTGPLITTYEAALDQAMQPRENGIINTDKMPRAAPIDQEEFFPRMGLVEIPHNQTSELSRQPHHEHTAETNHHPKLNQAGKVDVRLLAGTAGVMSLLSVGAKAAFTHIAPPLLETAMQAASASEVTSKAESDFEKGLLTQAQLNLIKDTTKETVAKATTASAIPGDPGLGSDLAVRFGDQSLVTALVATGLSEQLARSYEMGSLTGSLEQASSIAVNAGANSNDVKQMMNDNGAAPLSMALNIPRNQLQQLAAMSESLGGKALQTEVARSPAFEQLAALPPNQLTLLGNLAGSGIDPNVSVNDHGEIKMLSQQPVLSINNPKVAVLQATNYILQSGDSDFRAPKEAPILVQEVIDRFAKMYQQLNDDGGLSENDLAALTRASGTMATIAEQPQQTQVAQL